MSPARLSSTIPTQRTTRSAFIERCSGNEAYPKRDHSFIRSIYSPRQRVFFEVRHSQFVIYSPPVSDVTRALDAIQRGDSKAADQLLPLVYDELRKLAAHKMVHQPP